MGTPLKEWQIRGAWGLLDNNVMIIDTATGERRNIVQVAKDMHVAESMNKREREREREKK
jgi:hypothetical protein